MDKQSARYECSACNQRQVKLWVDDNDQSLLCIKCVEAHPCHLKGNQYINFVLPNQDWMELEWSERFEPAVGVECSHAPQSIKQWESMPLGILQARCEHLSFDDLFGELRSLAQSSETVSRSELIWFLDRACKLNATAYSEQWLPYLASMKLPQFYIEGSNREETFLELERLLPENAEIFYECVFPRYIIDFTNTQLQKITGLLVLETTGINATFWARLTRLKTLLVGNYSNESKRAFFRMLAQSPTTIGLERLDVFCHTMDDADIKQLVNSKYTTTLKALRISRTSITGAGVTAILQSTLPLESLKVYSSDILYFEQEPTSYTLPALSTVHLERLSAQDVGLFQRMFDGFDADFSYKIAPSNPTSSYHG